MSGFKVEFSVLNLKATPGIYADAFANRPAAGYPGRVFIDTDNPSTGMYRDTGTVWVQIAETATSDVDTLQNVTDNGNTTTNSISVGHANTPVSTIDVRQSTSGLNNASNWTITANNNPTIASGATFGTNYVNAIYGAQTQLFLQNATIGNSGLNTAGLFINTLQSNAPGSPGIITVTQASTIRAISGAQTGIYYGGTNVGVTYSHVAALKTFQPINTGSAATVTNNYGLIVADSTPSSGTITYTNRWGIYQEGASDKNYFAANVLIKSTTDNGNALQVTGQSNFTSNVGIGTISPTFIIDAQTSSLSVGRFLSNASGKRNNILIQNSGNFNYGVVGVVSATGTSTGDVYGLGYSASGSAAFTEVLNWTSGGNVGVGIVPTAYLGFVSSAAGISLHTNSTSGAAGLNFYENSSGRFSLRTLNGTAGLSFYDSFNATERMRITSGGNVGIGTTNPQSKIHALLNGNAAAGPTGTVAVIQNSTTGSNSYITLLGAFDSESGIVFTDESVAFRGKIAYNNSTEFMYFQTDGSERMRITSSGELLINTTTDVGDFKLQVSGNAYVSGNVGINTTSPNAVSLLQMDSTTKGFLLPRMTDAQINAISNPPDGLMVYSTDQHHIAFYDAGTTSWKKVNNSNL